MSMKNFSKEVIKADIEIEELSMQLADMLGVALHFAGVAKDDIPKAIDAYLDGIDEVYGDEDGEMGFEEIVTIINYLKDKKSKLFER